MGAGMPAPILFQKILNTKKLLFLFFILSCSRWDYEDESIFPASSAPETYLSLVALDTIYASLDSSGTVQFAIDEEPSGEFIWDPLPEALTTITSSRQELHWWGEDKDGDVIGYFYRWSSDTGWSYTNLESGIFYVPIRSELDVFSFQVKAVDNFGWFDTGDGATIDKNGYMRITDRSKDIIKSGGEWISSIDLENAAVGHPEIVEAAALGVTHPKWDERPILVVVTKENSNISKEQIFKFMESYVAKWQIPDDIIFVDQIPHTATGKISKIDLRKVLENKQYTHPDLK